MDISAHSRKEKHLVTQRVIVIEGCANLVVLILKLVVGLSTGSLAVLGDAIHDKTDVLVKLARLLGAAALIFYRQHPL